MSVTADVTKQGRTVVESVKVTVPRRETLVAEVRKPFHASLGLADLAVEQAKALPRTVPAELAKLQAQVKELPATLTAQVKALPTTVKTLPTQVKTQVETVSDKATTLYTELAVRGEKLVTSIRTQPSTQAVEKAATATVRNAKATAKSAAKTVKATEKAVDEAAGTLG